MNINRIWAVTLRNLYFFRVSIDRKIDIFFWPIVDLVLWGVTSRFFEQAAGQLSGVLVGIVSGVLLWTVWRQAQTELNYGLMTEIWDDNLFNLFSTPLKFSEFTVSFLFSGLVKSFLGIGFAMIVAFLLYRIEIFQIGFYLLPFMFVLLVNGWWFAFVINGLILRYGTKVQSFSWALLFVVAPFSAIYYPVSVLPSWAQFISKLTPTSYVFEGMREVLATGKLDWGLFSLSLLLTCVYTILSILFLRSGYRKLLDDGMLKLH